MEKKVRKHRTIFGKIYGYNLVLVVAAVLLSGMVSLYAAISIRQNDMDTVILNVAEFVAEMDIVAETLESGVFAENSELTEELDLVLSSFGELDILVVCDADSRRYYHNDHLKIGEMFQGDDQHPVLAGESPYITEAEGTLGMQRRAFYPVKDDTGAIIGFVMTSVLTSSIVSMRYRIMGLFLLILLVLLAVGALLSRAVMYHIRKLLMGYQPEEFRRLYVEREEVMNALEEGLIAINQDGVVTLMNESAQNILKIPAGEPTEGRQLQQFISDARLQNAFRTGRAEYNISVMIEKQTILASCIPVFHEGTIVGAVSILRDKTEVTKLAEELTGARYMVDTLRAFNHEFMNKLHIILGFLEMKEVEKAKTYILETSLVSGEAVSQISRMVPEANLAALLIGKLIRASELGITFSVKADSYFHEKERPLPVDCMITLTGNLLENAMDELNSKNYPVKEIELGIYSGEGHTMITCDDTGGGIPEDILFAIYDRHTTTKGEGHGSGFALIREIVDGYEGTIHIDTEPGMGTSIEIALPV